MAQFKYISNVNLDFNLTPVNAKLAEQYLNDKATDRISTVALIQRDYHVKVSPYQWNFHAQQAQIVVKSDHQLSPEALTALQQYTKAQVSDGGAEIASQAFAEVRNNQSVKPNIDFSYQFEPHADYDSITIDNGRNDFKFHAVPTED